MTVEEFCPFFAYKEGEIEIKFNILLNNKTKYNTFF